LRKLDESPFPRKSSNRSSRFDGSVQEGIAATPVVRVVRQQQRIMTGFKQVLWALDNEIDARGFERLCVDLLAREGYHHIVPIGGTKDHGRDAEIRGWRGVADDGAVVTFQFSLQESWERKLREDAEKIAKNCQNVCELVFVSSQAITGAKQDQLRAEFKAQRGWGLKVYSREWFRHRLTEFHQDLAQKYLGVDLAPTVGSSISLTNLNALDEESFSERLGGTSPELVRASILESTRKEPTQVGNWNQLARIEFLLRNYRGALEAINKALQLNPKDPVLLINLTNFKGAILAELGIQEHSRAPLIEAKNIFHNAAQRLKRAGDHFNLANVLGALGEAADAEKHYEQCLQKEPNFAEAWKNLGSLLLQKGARDRAMENFDKALHFKPNLVEAHLSKATAFLVFFERPEEAIRCFELGYELCPELDRKWRYVRYWFSRALLSVGRGKEALLQVEQELSLHPADRYLLNLKASILTKLQREDPASYEETTVRFLEFRAKAIPEDYSGLAKLTEILTKRGKGDQAWSSIDASLACKPFSLRDIAARAEIGLADFEAGFQNARRYKRFRRRFSLEDHCATFCGYGLDPNPIMLGALGYALIAPFGVIANEIRNARRRNALPDTQMLFGTTLKTVVRLLPLFGAHWLASSDPKDPKEQLRLLSIGIAYMADIVAAETARLIAFTAGSFGLRSQDLFNANDVSWKEVGAELGVRLLEQVCMDWQMVKTP
jgi:tetratricopeptide (TPR) repeat protein